MEGESLQNGPSALHTETPAQPHSACSAQVAQRARGAAHVCSAGGRTGPEATIWLPGADTPSYLNGELPGDFGFGAPCA